VGQELDSRSSAARATATRLANAGGGITSMQLAAGVGGGWRRRAFGAQPGDAIVRRRLAVLSAVKTGGDDDEDEDEDGAILPGRTTSRIMPFDKGASEFVPVVGSPSATAP